MKILFLSNLSALSILTLFFLSFKEPLFILKEIRIKGIKHMKEKEIMETISPFLEKGLYGIDEEKIRKILSSKSSVKDVRVKKVYPFSLFIEVEEKRPSALWIDSEGSIKVLDEKGRPFKNLGEENIEDLTIISAPTEEEAKEVFERMRGWIEKGIIGKEDIMEVCLKEGKITLFYKEDTEIFLGERDFDARLKDAIAIFEEARKKGFMLRYIDATCKEEDGTKERMGEDERRESYRRT